MLGEIRTFMLLFAGGFFVSSLYDLYRRFWLVRHSRTWKKHLGDIFFAMVASSVVIVLLFHSNWGEIRSFIFIGLGCGIITYFRVINIILGYLR